jgi:hypothetical protein
MQSNTATGSLAGRLESVAASLGGVFAQSEQVCLSTGESLGTTLESFGKLAEIFTALPAALNSEEFRGAVSRLSNLAGKIGDIGARLTDERAALGHLTELSHKITAPVERLRTDIRTISALTINAKVEARSIDDVGDDLNSFIEELSRLAASAQATIEDYWNEHARLVELLQSSCRAQATFESSHQAKLFAAARELKETLAMISARCEGACNSAGEISQRSNKIGQEIGAVVMALQVGDSTRQRIEHADASIGEIAALMQSDALAEEASRHEDADAMTTSVACRLVSAQIAHALHEFEVEMGRIVGSLGHLSKQARDMVAFGAKVYGGSDQDKDESFIGTLKSRLAISGALIQDASVARASVDRVLTAATDTLTSLQQRVRIVSGIVVDMTLIGMNGILKSVRVGNQGKGLSVIAQELRSYANHVIEGVERLKPALQQVIVSAEDFEASRLSRGQDSMAELERQMADALAEIQLSGTQMSDALKTLSQEGKRASGALDRSATDLGRNDDLRATLSNAAADLDDLAQDIDEDGLALPCGGLVPGFSRRYTMAAERQIHAAALSQAQREAA